MAGLPAAHHDIGKVYKHDQGTYRSAGCRRAEANRGYRDREPEPLGTGGGLRLALETCGNYPVLALNGDTYIELDYQAMWLAHKAADASFTVAVRDVPDASRYGRAVLEHGRLVGFASQGETGPGQINGGAYLFSKPLPDDLPKIFSFEKDYLEGAHRPCVQQHS